MFVILRIKYSMMEVKVRFTRHVAYAERRRRHGKVGDYKLNEKVICDCFQFRFFLFCQFQMILIEIMSTETWEATE
jgi:hypothetical protein